MSKENIKATSKPVAKKKDLNQFAIGIALLIFMIGVAFFLTSYSSKSVIIWVLGILAGFVLIRANFGFAPALRDPAMTGNTEMFKAVIIAIAVATAGFAFIQFFAVSQGLPVPGKISPVGIHTAIGGFIFGIGMVLAYGCASGTLAKIGNGFAASMIALVFFVIGSVLGVRNYAWWESTFMPDKGIFLPDVFGWIPALIIQFGMLFIVYLIAHWYGRRNF